MSDSSKSRRGLCFECTQCGSCCAFRGQYAHVYVDREETERLARLLDMPLSRFKKRYTFVDEYGWRQLRTKGERCVFQDPDTEACTVYPARPTQCRTFPFWREFVQDGRWRDEVRGLCEGVGRGRLYSIEEAEVQMVEMEESGEES